MWKIYIEFKYINPIPNNREFLNILNPKMDQRNEMDEEWDSWALDASLPFSLSLVVFHEKKSLFHPQLDFLTTLTKLFLVGRA